MKVLVIAPNVNFFRNLDTVVRELCRRGHHVVFLHGVDLDDPRVQRKMDRKKTRGARVLRARGLSEAEAAIPGVSSGYRPGPPEASCRALRFGRQVMNRAIYLRKNHPSPDRVVEGLERDMPPQLAARIHTPLWHAVLRQPASLRFWRHIEDASQPSATLRALLADLDPDVMLETPTVWPKDLVEADYVRAARSLKIPTIGYVNSWDNLTGKGTVHVLPDQYIVWNDAIAEEAIDLHQIPPDTIRITGAPHLDRFFSMRTTATREEICAGMGCPTDRPYVTYLCSSRTLIHSEVDVATRVADALSRRFPASTPTLVVRPHPTNPFPWVHYQHPHVVVYPKAGDLADSPDSWQQYFNQLANGACVFGINTTAFLESVVAGQPCLTMVADEFWPSQGRTGHFRHLLRGHFLEVASDADDVAMRVARILDGVDERKADRAAFTRWFLRPCGLEQPAADVVADVIERAARPHREAVLSTAGGSIDPVPGLTPISRGAAR